MAHGPRKKQLEFGGNTGPDSETLPFVVLSTPHCFSENTHEWNSESA